MVCAPVASAVVLQEAVPDASEIPEHPEMLAPASRKSTVPVGAALTALPAMDGVKVTVCPTTEGVTEEASETLGCAFVAPGTVKEYEAIVPRRSETSPVDNGASCPSAAKANKVWDPLATPLNDAVKGPLPAAAVQAPVRE